MNSPTGFSLIELMVTLVVAIVVLTIGVPSLQTLVENNGLTAQINQFIVDLNLARSEAVRRGRQITLCKTADGKECVKGTGYEAGWIVFVESAQSIGARNAATEELVRAHDALKAGYTLRGNNNFANRITFDPSGDANTLGRFVLCKDGRKEKARVIFVNIAGQIRIAPDSNGNDIPEDQAGKDIAGCEL